MLLLVGQHLPLGRRQEHVADLEQRHPSGLASLVERDRLDQTGQQRRAEHRLLRHHRVGEHDADRRESAALEVAGRQERQGQHLGQPETPQEPADLAAGLLLGREPAGPRGRERPPLDAVVAPVAGHLLDDVDLDLAVVAPRGDDHVVIGLASVRGGHLYAREPDRFELGADLRRGQLGAQQPVHPGRSRAHGWPRRQLAVHVDRIRGHGGTADVSGQLAEAGRGERDALRIAPLLEPGRCLGAEPEAARGAADRPRLEPGHLEQHVRRGRADLTRRAAHDPGDADRLALGVADEQVVGRARALDIVEGHQALALLRPPDHQPTARHEVQVVRVVGLAELEHHVVRDVDERVDRPHPEREQAALHPVGRRADRDVAQHPGAEPSAQIGVGDLDRDRIGGRRPRGCDLRRRQRERQIERGRRVASQAGDRHRVRTIRVDLEVPEDVVHDTEGVGEGGSRVGGDVEDADAGVVVAQTELAAGAEHAVGELAADLAATDLHASRHGRAHGGERHQVAHGHVERTADDLDRTVTRVHVDQLHLVRVGVLAQGLDPPDHDAVPLGAEVGDRLDRGAEAVEGVADQVRVVGEGRELLEPGEERLHQNWLRKRMSVDMTSRMSDTP